MPPTPPPDLRAFATASGAAEVWAGPVALALHLLRLALGPDAAEAAARAAGA